jgi:hypothetical protein
MDNQLSISARIALTRNLATLSEGRFAPSLVFPDKLGFIDWLRYTGKAPDSFIHTSNHQFLSLPFELWGMQRPGPRGGYMYKDFYVYDATGKVAINARDADSWIFENEKLIEGGDTVFSIDEWLCCRVPYEKGLDSFPLSGNLDGEHEIAWQWPPVGAFYFVDCGPGGIECSSGIQFLQPGM